MTQDEKFQQFTEAHPNLWAHLLQIWPNRNVSQFAAGRVNGYISCISNVGGFDTTYIERQIKCTISQVS